MMLFSFSSIRDKVVAIIVAWSHLFPRCEIGYESSNLARKEEGMYIYIYIGISSSVGVADLSTELPILLLLLLREARGQDASSDISPVPCKRYLLVEARTFEQSAVTNAGVSRHVQISTRGRLLLANPRGRQWALIG